MLKIAIIDDEVFEQERIQGELKHWLEQHGVEARIEKFESGPLLFKYCEMEEIYFDMALVDVEMEAMNGIEVARQLKQINKACLTIFITHYAVSVYEGYKVGAFRYILKENIEIGLPEAMEAALMELCDQEKYFTYISKKKHMRILCKDIIYFESKRRVIQMYVKGEETPRTFYDQLSKIEACLTSEKFIRCHQSFLVNESYIIGLEEKQLRLTVNQMKLPISEKYKKQVEAHILWSVR